MLGFEDAACGDEVLRHLVVARIIEPVSKLDSIRVRRAGHVTTGQCQCDPGRCRLDRPWAVWRGARPSVPSVTV